MFTRQQVVDAARSYIGVNFRMYGRDRTGLDCVGLLYCVGKDLGIEGHHDTDYSRQPEPAKLQAMLDQYTRPAKANPPRSGRVLKLRQMIFPMHIGILVVENGRLSVINANVKRHKVVEDSWEVWKNLVMEYRDIKGVMN